MGTSQRSGTRLWDLAFQKLFPKRYKNKGRDDSSDNTFQISRSFEGLHNTSGYSQYFMTVEAEKLANLKLKRSHSTERSYSSAMAPVDHSVDQPIDQVDYKPLEPLKPFAVSAPEWFLTHPPSRKVVLADQPKYDVNGLDRTHSVLKVLTKVYSIGKVFVTILQYFGSEVDDSPKGLLTLVQRVEEIITTQSVVDLIEVVESLYYCLYSRIVTEIAHTELCNMFPSIDRKRANIVGFVLPEPAHMFKLYVACKQILDRKTVCSVLDKQVIWQHQDEFNSRALAQLLESRVEPGANDASGYRQYTMSILKGDTSQYCMKWRTFFSIYRKPMIELTTHLSEKYTALLPKIDIEQEHEASELRFVDPATVDHKAWDQELVQGHRDATLAKLEGKSVGEIRRENQRRRLIDYARERKCMCTQTCGCAEDCTLEVERACPCSERMVRVLTTQRRKNPGKLAFGVRCSSVARLIFEGVGSFKRGLPSGDVMVELDRALAMLEDEIIKERLAAAYAGQEEEK